MTDTAYIGAAFVKIKTGPLPQPGENDLDLSIYISPETLGATFARMDHEEQSRFLNAVGAVVMSWPNQMSQWMNQCEAIDEADKLTQAARDVMKYLGEWS